MPNTIAEALTRSFDIAKEIPAIPIDRSLIGRYSGTDLKGCYCQFDAEAKTISKQIQASLQTKPEAVKNAVKTLSEASEPYYDKFQRACVRYRQLELAETLVTEAEAKNNIQRHKQFLAQSPDITNYQTCLLATQYLTGDAKNPVIPNAVKDFCINELRVPLDYSVMQQSRNQVMHAPDPMTIHMEPMNSCIDLLHYSRPAVFLSPNPRAVPVDHTERGKEVAQLIPAYTARTFARELGVYDQLESLKLPPRNGQTEPLAKEDLIYVNGVSLRQYGSEARKQNPAMTREELAQYTNNLLSQSLLEGRQVEAYLPDYQSKTIRKEPVRLTPEGLTPKEMTRPVMTRWQEYWSKRGYYKELSAKVQEYDQIQAQRKEMKTQMKQTTQQITADWGSQIKAEHAQIAHTYNQRQETEIRDLKQQMFGPAYLDDVDALPSNDLYRNSRGALTLGICLMINKGYPLTSILDPEQLQTERKQAGEELVAKTLRNDPQEYYEMIIPAIRTLTTLPNPAMDFSNFKDVADHRRELYARGYVTFDLCQELTHNQEVHNYVSKDIYNNLENASGMLGMYYNGLSKKIAVSDPEWYDKRAGFGVTAATTKDRMNNIIASHYLTDNHSVEFNQGVNPSEFATYDNMIQINACFTTGVIGPSSMDKIRTAGENMLSERPFANVTMDRTGFPSIELVNTKTQAPPALNPPAPHR